MCRASLCRPGTTRCSQPASGTMAGDARRAPALRLHSRGRGSRKTRPRKRPVQGRQAGRRRSSPARRSRRLRLSFGRPGVPAAFFPDCAESEHPSARVLTARLLTIGPKRKSAAPSMRSSNVAIPALSGGWPLPAGCGTRGGAFVAMRRLGCERSRREASVRTGRTAAWKASARYAPIRQRAPRIASHSSP